MGTIKQGILGGFSGKVGTVVGSSYPADWSGDTVHIYLTFVSEDGTLVSDSEYVGSETIA